MQGNPQEESFTFLTIEAEPTRDGGDPARGREFVVGGSYEAGGVPYSIYTQLLPPDPENLLRRSGPAAELPPNFNFVTSAEGVEFVGHSCFGCHAGRINGVFVEGLPNAFPSIPPVAVFEATRPLVESTYGRDSAELVVFDRVYRPLVAAAKIPLPFDGLVSASVVGAVGFSHRDPKEMTWLEEPLYELDSWGLASDPIPWWHVRKHHAFFATGFARGDLARLALLPAVFTTSGREHLERLDEHAPDLLAYLRSIEPPAYPAAIDAGPAGQGERIFESRCSTCHGTYGDVETYPNRLVHVDVVGTDPLYAEQFLRDNFAEVYSTSWWGTTGELPSRGESHRGYVAPPLDGIWATAPYLHNGSVPTIEGVLDSSLRPRYWRRDFVNRAYDVAAPGLVYEATEGPGGGAYDTTLPGYSNEGHTFGDSLSAEDRRALIEYLKTL